MVSVTLRFKEMQMMDLKAANHAGRELDLMLAGRKPLAMFYAFTDELPHEELIPEDSFAPYVESGNFVRSEAVFEDVHPTTGHPLQLKYVFFTSKGEEWRIPAMKLVVATFRRISRADEGLERMECTLLGYTEDETEAWCRYQFQNATA